MHFVEDIIDRMEARLKTITIVNGYSHDIGENKVENATLTAPKNQDLPKINIWSDGFDTEKDAFGRDQHLVRIYIEGRARTMDEPFQTVAARLTKDIHRSLHRDPTDPDYSTGAFSRDLGEKVGDLAINTCEFFIGEGGKPFCATLLTYAVITYTAMGDFETHGPNVGMD